MLKGLRLLCIDSERGVSELIREALEYNRATIDWAGTAKGGLKAARVTSYDVILLEHDLPDIDGISVLETLRTENIQTPVIMLSAFGSQEVATRAIKSGASDFIMKDINLGFLDVLPPLILKTVEYHQTENEREAAKEALAYERMRSTVLRQFIQDASHEFRTPLTIIKSSAHILTELAEVPAQERHTTRILEQADNILQLVEDLVLLADLDARSHIKQHFINLVDVVIAAYQQEQDNFQASNIMFSLLPPPAPLLVPADAELLVTAITHILNNARQHTTADGTVNLLLTHDDGHANVRIEDNGAGMSEEIQTHMFQRFYRGSNRRQLRGFGLGLPIVQRIVELHDGTINIDSTVNAGTTVTIRLPRAVTNTLT